MRKQKVPRLLTILIMTAITVVFWIGIEVYRALTIKPAPIVPARVSLPLSPNLDENVLSGLEKRVYITEEEINPVQLKTTQQAQPTIVASPIPNPSPEESPIPEETIIPEATP